MHFQSRTWEGQINVHGIYDHREGGQTHHPSIDHKDLLTYDHTNQRLEIFGNIGFWVLKILIVRLVFNGTSNVTNTMLRMQGKPMVQMFHRIPI